MIQNPFSVIFLAGGNGSRMGGVLPKQYLSIHGKPLALYSFERFLSLTEIEEISVVCDELYEELFRKASESWEGLLKFARPGSRRQDSVLNGLNVLESRGYICIHDSARPLIRSKEIRLAVQAAYQWGASALGVKVKSTIKICDESQVVVETPNRANLWKIQTPQVVRRDLLEKGFQYVSQHQKSVTDDVSLIELLGESVKIVEGSEENIKVTTPADLEFVKTLLVSKMKGAHALLQDYSSI
jgi:2-C-methyl-D-erythritol 4-phosphate cytidylyltransferase